MDLPIGFCLQRSFHDLRIIRVGNDFLTLADLKRSDHCSLKVVQRDLPVIGIQLCQIFLVICVTANVRIQVYVFNISSGSITPSRRNQIRFHSNHFCQTRRAISQPRSSFRIGSIWVQSRQNILRNHAGTSDVSCLRSITRLMGSTRVEFILPTAIDKIR